MKNHEVSESLGTKKWLGIGPIFLNLKTRISTIIPSFIYKLWLPGLFLIEMVVFLPMDLILAGYCYKWKDRAYFMAVICAICSTISGFASYLVGLFAWEQVGKKFVETVISKSFFLKMTSIYKTYEFPAVLIGGLLPFPLKAITLSAGFCKLNAANFICALLMSRLIRFSLTAYLAKNYGDQAIGLAKNLSLGRFVSVVTAMFIIFINKVL